MAEAEGVKSQVLWEDWWLASARGSPSPLLWWAAGNSQLVISDIRETNRGWGSGCAWSGLLKQWVQVEGEKEACSQRPQREFGEDSWE